MSYEQFKKDIKLTASSYDNEVMEDLDHAFRTDENLLEKAYAALYNLERTVKNLRNDIQQYEARLNQKP